MFYKLGILAGMALAQGGGLFPVISKTTWKYICGTSIADLEPSIDEVSEISKRTFLEEVLYENAYL